MSVLGSAQPDLMDKIFKTLDDYGCNVEDGRMGRLGGELALFVMFSGSWDAIAKIEAYIPKMEQALNIHINFCRTEPRKPSTPSVPYAIEVIAVNRTGLVYDISNFFSRQQIGIEDMCSGTYLASHTATEMFSLQFTISIPTGISIAALRGEFMEYCDQLNIDSIMEPVK